MVRDLVRNYWSVVSDDARNRVTATRHLKTRLVTALVFIFACALSVWAVATQGNVGTLRESHLQPDSVQANLLAPSEEVQQPAEQPSNDSDSKGDDKSSHSVKTEVKVEDSQAETKVEVNGQKIPINPDGTTHTTISGNGSQTTVDVNIQSSGADTNTFVGSNSNSSSFTSSVQSQTVLILP